jgi:hypothetical protein
MGFVIRWLCAFVLLAATFNPTPFNYVDWVRYYGDEHLSIAVLTGLLLFIGYIVYLRATLRSIGGFGMLLVLAVIGATLWVLHDLGVLRLDNSSVNVWLGLRAGHRVELEPHPPRPVRPGGRGRRGRLRDHGPENAERSDTG